MQDAFDLLVQSSALHSQVFLGAAFWFVDKPSFVFSRPMTATMDEVTTNPSLQMLLASIFSGP